MAQIAQWTFDEPPLSGVAADTESGDGTAQDGVFQDGATTTGSGAGVFDGANDYVEIASDPGFDLASGSIVITFTQDTASTGDVPYGSTPAQTLFSCDSSGYDSGGHLTIFIKSDGSIGVRHQDTDESFDYSGGSVTLGQPTTVVYTWSPSGSQLSVDGVVVDTGTEPLVLAGDTEPMTIGASQAESGDGTADNLTGFFDGEIEGVAIHDGPVSADTVPCFTKSTLILTPNGAIAVEDLCVGDLVCTMANGPQPIRWIGSRRVELGVAADAGDKRRPVRITAGALGGGLPTRDLLVSRQHRMLISSKIAARMFDRFDVLGAAKNLIGLPGIHIDRSVRSIEYYHLMFDRHEVIFAEDAPTESFYTGAEAINAVSAKTRQEILALSPVLDTGTHSADPALPIPTARRLMQLVARHAKHRRPLLETFVVAAAIKRPGRDLPG